LCAQDVSVVLVKVALSLGLLLTFPVMLLPVYEILETSLLASQRFCSMVRPSIRHVAFSLVRVAVVAVTVRALLSFKAPH
jgi:thiol:disulfide interchange protein